MQSTVEYIFETAFWTVISIIWFKNLLFRCIPGYTLKASKITMLSMLILLSTFGVLLTISNWRNGLSVFVNILLPYEAYTALAFWKDMRLLTAIAIGISLLLAVVYFVLCVAQTVHNKSRKKQIVLKRIKYGFAGSRTVIACCMLILMIPMIINSFLGETMAFNKTDAEIPSGVNECTIANNIEVVSKLCQEKWEALDLNEKVNTLQTVANIESYYLGLPHELNVKVDTLEEDTIAQYYDRTHTITVNISYLETMQAAEVLDSICHESYHAYQHRLCDVYGSLDPEYRNLLTFHSIPSYIDEFCNYNDGSEDVFDYYFQMCEIHARAYAEDSVVDYYNKIEMYTSDEG